MPNSSTYHLPVVTSYKAHLKIKKYTHSIKKRSLKDFTERRWIDCLAKKDWSLLEECESVNQMAEVFDEIIQEALDEIAPVKSFTVKSQYKFGLSTEAIH